jgi:hypothetical protein
MILNLVRGVLWVQVENFAYFSINEKKLFFFNKFILINAIRQIWTCDMNFYLCDILKDRR